MEFTEGIIDLTHLAKIWTECILIQQNLQVRQSKGSKKQFYNNIDRQAIYLRL